MEREKNGNGEKIKKNLSKEISEELLVTDYADSIPKGLTSVSNANGFFYLNLPIVSVLEENMSEEKLKILIVDDESTIRDLFYDLLTHEGYKVTKADSGDEAIKNIKKSPQQIAFIDMRMSGMNGLQTYLALKEIDPKIVGVIITGYAVETTVREALSKEAFCCMYKPFDIDEITEVIKNIEEKLL